MTEQQRQGATNMTTTTPAANLPFPQLVEALEQAPVGTAITFTVAGIERQGTFLGLTTQDGYRYAKAAFTYKGRQVRDLVYLANLLTVEV